LLFDLPGSDYSNFYEVERNYYAMIKIFEMYQRQKMMRNNWAKTLWENLDPQELISGMDNFLKEFRKLPLSIRNLPVARTLDISMKNFKNSVPLFVELKNEAMRERHWKELMDRTGKHFDMSPDRFAK
jgi:dynein heavy chain